METAVGPVKLRLYGTILLNLSFSDSPEVGQEVPLWPSPAPTVTLANGTTKPAVIDSRYNLHSSTKHFGRGAQSGECARERLDAFRRGRN